MTRYNRFYCYLFCSKGLLVGNWHYLSSIYPLPPAQEIPTVVGSRTAFGFGIIARFLLFSVVAVTVLHGLVHVLKLLAHNF